jgi:hypothetical protein
MIIVLEECLGKTASTVFLSDEIFNRNLYRVKTGGKAMPAQIYLRARRYPELFEIEGRNTIRLKSKNTMIVKEAEGAYQSGTNQIVNEPKIKSTNDIEIERILEYLERNPVSIENLSYNTDSGVYAIHFYGREFPLQYAVEYVKIRPIIYIGKTESSFSSRDFKTHFANGRTGVSTLRRSLGALLLVELNLKPIPRGSGRTEMDFRNYKFVDDGEERLTAWMKSNLQLSVYPLNQERIAKIENKLIKLAVPVLNLKDNYGNLFYRTIEEKRNNCVQLAKQNRDQHGR